MCGICGKIYLDSSSAVDTGLIRRMINVMEHRGPDGEGTYIDGPVGLGHKRLTILDLHAGKQPITNEDSTVWLVFNGEIYNYIELKKELRAKGHIFKTNTDSEVIVHAYEEYGEGCIELFRGMFAFAIWDSRDKTMLLARDRVGIKPLYYALNDRHLIFASEMKAIMEDADVDIEVNLSGIHRFLGHRYIPGSDTMVKGIYKLAPGHSMAVKDGKVSIRRYWDLDFPSQPVDIPFDDAKSELIKILSESMRLHMISDVPVGFLISGGVDSTALLSFARDSTEKEISTFTVGFDGEGFADERPYARVASRLFNTTHYEMSITAKEFGDFLPEYVSHMEEPVCEPPAIALYYISKLASDHVKVLLSGEGGDEAFAGYPNYRNYVWLERIKRASGPLKKVVASLASLLALMPRLSRLRFFARLMDIPLEKYYMSRTATPLNFFNSEGGIYTDSFQNEIINHPDNNYLAELFANVANQGDLNRMLYIDTKTWLPDDLLVKADKMTMANSVELRVPLLDHKILEFAASLPQHYKLNGTTTKHILKEAFEKRVPSEILNRKKTGFPVPYDSWLRNDLNSTVNDILLDSRTLQRGYFNKKEVEALIRNNQESNNYPKEIFSLITLELWHREILEKRV